MLKLAAPFLAFSVALGSSAAALSAPSTSSVQMYSSAQTIEERVAKRRTLRKHGSPTVTARVRKKPTIPRRTVTKIQKPDTADATSSLLNKRAKRRSKRLAGKPVPIKVQVIDGVNLERAKHAVPPLRYHTNLEVAAQLHAADMQSRDYFSHENPEGQRVGDRVRKNWIRSNQCSGMQL